MRTTIDLPEELLAQIRRLAAASRTTVTALIEDALRDALQRRRRKRKHEPTKLKRSVTEASSPALTSAIPPPYST